MSYQEIFISGAIAILYQFFFSRFADIYTNKSQIDHMCDGLENYTINFQDRLKDRSKIIENQKCTKQQEKLRNKASTTYFLILMAIGVFGIVFSVSGLVKSGSTNVGFSLGGLLCILRAICNYWDQMNDYMKLGITGSSLAILIYVSMMIYNI